MFATQRLQRMNFCERHVCTSFARLMHRMQPCLRTKAKFVALLISSAFWRSIRKIPLTCFSAIYLKYFLLLQKIAKEFQLTKAFLHIHHVIYSVILLTRLEFTFGLCKKIALVRLDDESRLVLSLSVIRERFILSTTL